ncbi:MAG: FAD-dependent oxidoreductase [Balneolaceae bacterium]|nr:FAD-dependent oxidoreductase [Balneolaceae bacterium]
MVIGIIGASLSGLIAGEKLARAGHDVTLIEKSRELGGRLATHRIDDDFFDYGVPFLTAQNRKFQSFIDELQSKDLLYQWADSFPLYDGSQLHSINPNRPKAAYYAGKDGLNRVAENLKRWIDIKSEEKAGGLTHIGADRSRKRAWMINLTDITVFECDAVILATPATEAYGILQTAQDETPARRIIRVIDEIQYQPRFALMASYKEETPSWKGIECNDNTLAWIGNESSKSEKQSATNIVIHSSAQFARTYAEKDLDEVAHLLLEKAADIAEPWLAHPKKTYLRHWKYYRARNPLEDYFMELEMEEAPLALIGDYFKGNSAEAAYLSGYHLADYWINKYATAEAEN